MWWAKALYLLPAVVLRPAAVCIVLCHMSANVAATLSTLVAPQDLPNYAQHTVPIFSLPTEWLWCETWCGNTTKPQVSVRCLGGDQGP